MVAIPNLSLFLLAVITFSRVLHFSTHRCGAVNVCGDSVS